MPNLTTNTRQSLNLVHPELLVTPAKTATSYYFEPRFKLRNESSQYSVNNFHFTIIRTTSMELIEHLNDVFTIQSLWSPSICQQFIQKSEIEGYEKALVNTINGPVKMEDFRNNDRLFWEDASLAEQIWKQIEEFVPCDLGDYQAIGLNELFRFYRYDVAQQFNWHYDAAYQRNQNEQSFYTFMIYLNEDFEGGATAFEGIEVAPKTGDAIFFSQELEHAGLPITSGRKYILRTDIMYSNLH